jgi:hypothetical protein
VDREGGDVGGFDDSPDRQRRAELLAASVELIAEQRSRQLCVDEAGRARRLTRIGACSTARLFVSAGSAAVSG